MNSLGCRSGHSGETDCRGCCAEFGGDVVVDLGEEDERTTGRKG